jgi:hypothetical protein
VIALELGCLEDVAPEEVRIGKPYDGVLVESTFISKELSSFCTKRHTMYKNGYTLRGCGRGVSIRVHNIVESCSRAGEEERVSKTRQRLAIEAPVLLLSGGKFVLLLSSVPCP